MISKTFYSISMKTNSHSSSQLSNRQQSIDFTLITRQPASHSHRAFAWLKKVQIE